MVTAYQNSRYTITKTQEAGGKWTYGESAQSIDETGVFFALMGSDHVCYGKIQEIMSKLLQKTNVAIAILACK